MIKRKYGLFVFLAAFAIGIVIAGLMSFGRIPAEFVERLPISFGSEIVGSGERVVEERTVPEFSKIEISGALIVEAVANDEFGLTIEADENLLGNIKTLVDDEGTLRVFPESTIRARGPVLVKISAPSIEAISVSGASRVNASRLKNDTLTVDSSGASKIILSGSTDEIVLDISGASVISADELVSRKAVVDSSGASRIALNVSESIEVDCSGASRVTYAGNPAVIKKSTSGASSVRQSGD